ncbi:DUF6328 family protein [Bdellovibrio sp. HCB185ZH]|uniref:DUF6328 family protein n=1 Tax=Bdellovibrio sp. HCB185ZH TaxID=3394235 RepID=UPI0039A45454
MKTEIQNEDLKEEVQHIESETRMILPGIQALFGFQLVAVFNDRFETALTSQLQLLHWLALGFTAVATVFAIAPVAYHRIAVPHIVTRHFVTYSNLCIKILLLPLILGCTIVSF